MKDDIYDKMIASQVDLEVQFTCRYCHKQLLTGVIPEVFEHNDELWCGSGRVDPLYPLEPIGDILRDEHRDLLAESKHICTKKPVA